MKERIIKTTESELKLITSCLINVAIANKNKIQQLSDTLPIGKLNENNNLIFVLAKQISSGDLDVKFTEVKNNGKTATFIGENPR